MTRVEEREHNCHIANVYSYLRKPIIHLLNDYKIYVDYDERNPERDSKLEMIKFVIDKLQKEV